MKTFREDGTPLEKMGMSFTGIRTEIAEAAANWWIDQMSGNKQNWDNGAFEPGGAKDMEQAAMMTLLGNLAANTARDRIHTGQFEIFRETLITSIKEEYERKMEWAKENSPDRIESGWCNVGLHTDYHPEGILRDAAEKAGIDGQAFPCKTGMWISDKKVSVSLGYGADTEIIFNLEKI